VGAGRVMTLPEKSLNAELISDSGGLVNTYIDANVA
jgi:hypothetical protein